MQSRPAAERREELVALYKEAKACERCPLHATRTQVVFGAGNADADLMFVGEAPGQQEDLQGLPFVGRAGKLLDQLLEEDGLKREDVFITNVVKARPPGNRDPKAAEVAHHRPWLERQLALIRPEVVIPVGRHALAHFAPGRKITEVHGAVLAAGDWRLVPWLHPAAALRSPGLRETLFQDARALPGILEAARASRRA